MPLQNKQSVSFLPPLSNQVLCRFVQLCKYGHHFFFLLRKHLYLLSGVFREAAVCMLHGNPAMIVHVETCAFVS